LCKSYARSAANSKSVFASYARTHAHTHPRPCARAHYEVVNAIK
jgi:hypothetical protein